MQAFADAALAGGEAAVTLHDGSRAVLMGLAAHRAIETGRPVLWTQMLDEFEAQKDRYHFFLIQAMVRASLSGD